MMIDDGNCAIDIAFDEESLEDADASTYRSIRVAAEDIINTCVGRRTPNKGGYVTDLGIQYSPFLDQSLVIPSIATSTSAASHGCLLHIVSMTACNCAIGDC